MIALTACLAMMLFLVTIVIPRSLLPEPSAHPSSIVAAPTLTASVNPYVPTDYGVNTIIVNGVVYAGSGAVYAIRGSDGSRLWYHSMYWVVYEPPMLVESTIFVSTAGGDVYAFQASNGSLLWHFHIYVQ
ncbi:MAG TPA: PQQ-binding-like beta-propeller repeat protein [Ktedonobacteraceae bacterium]|nr:PQQ-binding-like beta-propeller repeat protein [Ktedonobacteraceae bacterium]